MDRLEAMRLFVRVAEVGSFSAAATQLNVARSVVTRRILALERYLGVQLIVRNTRRLALTPAGTAYLEKCREILARIEEAEAALSADNQVPRGHLRITLPLSFGVRQLMPLLTTFLESHPAISFELDFNDRRVDLIEGGFDLAIRIADRLLPGDVARRISASRLVDVAAPSYLERQGRPLHPADLKHHECFGYLLDDHSSWAYQIEGEWRRFPVSGRLAANSGEALLAAARSGLGIARLPTFLAADAVRSGELEILLADYPAPTLGVYAVYPDNRHVPHRVRALVDHLVETLGSHPFWDRICEEREAG